MKLTNIKIHNIRSIKDSDIHLSDYSILIGANNAGKSNIISALRLFYGDEMSFKEERDLPKFMGASNSESWIELGFTTISEEQANLRDEYKSSDSILRVRRYFKSNDVEVKQNQSNVFAYENGKLSKNLFYGAKNISQGKFGKVIYIPAISKASDNLKTSGVSPFRNLMMMVMKGTVQNSSSFEQLDKNIQIFSNNFRKEPNAGGISVNKIVSDVNKEMSGWGIKFDIDINSPKPEDIIKNLLNYRLKDETLGDKQVELELYGQGLQRQLIYSLIKLCSSYNKPPTTKSKDFSPNFSLILFEEPEAFLHPSQQDVLSYSLRELSKNTDQQVIVTSHSSHFVSKNFDDIPSIINVRKDDNGVSYTYQIKQDDMKHMLEKNTEHIKAAHNNKISPTTGLDIREEEFRYGIYLDSERSSMFFAKHVVICEGATEKALFNCLLDKEWTDLKNKQIYFLDSLGKYNIHRFIALLHHLGIPHSVIHDSDESDTQARLNKMIESNKTEMTKEIYAFDIDLENFLGIEIKKKDKERSDRKPLNIVSAYLNGEIDKEKINKLREIVDKIVV